MLVSQVASAVGKSSQTIKRWSRLGKIPKGSRLKSSGRIVFTMAEFEEIRRFATETVPGDEQ